MGINDAGQIIGNSTTDGYLRAHAFLYEQGVMSDIGTLGGTESTASSINNAGQVVGGSMLSGDSAEHAFLYDKGNMFDIGGLVDSIFSNATDINDAGQVVGYSRFNAGDDHAFYYDQGKMFDLNDLIDPLSGWELTGASGINNTGQIVANGCNRQINQCQGLLLDRINSSTQASSVPEPSSLALLLLGLFGLVRKRQAN